MILTDQLKLLLHVLLSPVWVLHAPRPPLGGAVVKVTEGHVPAIPGQVGSGSTPRHQSLKAHSRRSGARSALRSEVLGAVSG